MAFPLATTSHSIAIFSPAAAAPLLLAVILHSALFSIAPVLFTTSHSIAIFSPAAAAPVLLAVVLHFASTPAMATLLTVSSSVLTPTTSFPLCRFQLHVSLAASCHHRTEGGPLSEFNTLLARSCLEARGYKTNVF